VSDILSPPVIWALLAFPIAYHADGGQGNALIYALVYGTMVCWLPLLYIAWNVRNGNISDLHMKVRQERIRPFVVTLLGASAALALLVAFNAPRLMPMFTLFSLIQLGLMTLITLVWQISIHAMSITGAVVAAGAIYGVGPALVLFPLVPLVGAARYKLGRHTVAQLIAGASVGALMTLLLFTVV
jgi:membrane-associated phospholipid phosphatase